MEEKILFEKDNFNLKNPKHLQYNMYLSFIHQEQLK